MTVDKQHLPEGFEDSQTEEKKFVGHGIERLTRRQHDERTETVIGMVSRRTEYR